MRLSRADLRALLFCACFFSLVAATSVCLVRCGGKDAERPLTEEELREIKLLESEIRKDSFERASRRGGHSLADELFPFDPNHDDSLTLARLGLRPWQIHNMMRYRAAGGVWRSADDFKRLYGLSAEEFKRLKPYVRISAADRKRSAPAYDSSYYGTPRGEKPQFEKIEKYAEGTLVPINSADTTELKRIPGIGSYYAQKIVRYRERLGGFVRVSQISEVEGLPAGAARWFSIETSPQPVRININKATFSQLVRHPYLSYEQTKAIVNHVRSYGPLKSWRDLRLYKEFTEDDFTRLAPYFVFDKEKE